MMCRYLRLWGERVHGKALVLALRGLVRSHIGSKVLQVPSACLEQHPGVGLAHSRHGCDGSDRLCDCDVGAYVVSAWPFADACDGIVRFVHDAVLLSICTGEDGRLGPSRCSQLRGSRR